MLLHFSITLWIEILIFYLIQNNLKRYEEVILKKTDKYNQIRYKILTNFLIVIVDIF